MSRPARDSPAGATPGTPGRTGRAVPRARTAAEAEPAAPRPATGVALSAEQASVGQGSGADPEPDRSGDPAPPGGTCPGPGTDDALDRSRVSLVETATHTGTWMWDALRNTFAVSDSLCALFPSGPTAGREGALPLVGDALTEVTPVGPASSSAGVGQVGVPDGGSGAGHRAGRTGPAMPGRLADLLRLAVDSDRAHLALMVATAWMHQASFEVTHHAGSAESPVAVRHVGRVVTAEDGPILGMVGAVTTLPAADEIDPLSDSETATRHRNLIRVLPSAVIVHQDGVIVHANPAAHALVSERGPVQLLGTPILELVAPESRRPMMDRVLAMSAPGAIAPAEAEELLLPDGTRIPVEVVSIRTTWRGRPAGQAVIADVRERQALMDRLTHDATHDDLTGLGNRRLIEEELRRYLSSGRDFGVLFVDLDKFKDVNDSHGHSTGDQVLLQTVGRLRAAAAGYPQTFLGRLSGDEFLILTSDVEAAESLAADICQAVATPFTVGDWKVVITASVGVLRVDVRCYEGHDAWDVIRDADVAMYRAKQLGRNRWTLFDETMRHKLQRRVATTEYLRRAVTDPVRSRMHLVYQPIVEADTGRPRAVETLIRWSDPSLGAIFPDEFIPLAEETGLIVPLGRWIVRTACEQLAVWRRDHRQLAELRVAVNLSPRQLADPSLMATVRSVLHDVGLPPDALCLEITETALADDIDAAYRTVTSLRDLGVELSIDDFGTGYSSLAYLRNLPVSEVKVDRSFVSGLGEHVRDEKICTSVISMAHVLGLKVVAEGIESQLQLDHLREGGCDYVQGYFLCRPQPPDQVLGYLLDPSGAPKTGHVPSARDHSATRI
jgi:diguanylate cyclase (GGDEF)-like protein/PAS domain S-box-containing protein